MKRKNFKIKFRRKLKKHQKIADTMHIIEEERKKTSDDLEIIDEELIGNFPLTLKYPAAIDVEKNEQLMCREDR